MQRRTLFIAGSALAATTAGGGSAPRSTGLAPAKASSEDGIAIGGTDPDA